MPDDRPIKKHYHVHCYVVCDFLGQQCGEDGPYGESIIPDCKTCQVYKDHKNVR